MKYILGPMLALVLFSCKQDTDKAGFKKISGIEIYYEEHGSGPPLLLLSGGGIHRTVRDFDKCVPDLSKKYRVILPDSPGQGKSGQPDTLTYEILTNIMSAFIDSMHLDSVYVMGLSDGGIASLLLAESRPDKVKKVIAVGANSGLKGVVPDGIDPSKVKPQPLEIWGERNKKWVDDYMKNSREDWKKIMNSLNAMWYQEKYFSDSVLMRIRIPVMIALGDKDDIPVSHASELHKLIPGSRIFILPNTTHEVFDERPEMITKIAADFFK